MFRSVSIYSKTIKQTVENINTLYFLPDIQRDYLWDEDRVISLFDSILKGYPIGSILIWKQSVEDYNHANYSFYKLISTAKATDNSGEVLRKPASVVVGSRKNLYAVLDGQQRLTAFYLALSGGYQIWKGKGRHPQGTPPLRELYFSPAGRSSKNCQTKNEFRFFSGSDVPDSWYKVKDIYGAKSGEEFCKNHSIEKRPQKTQIELLRRKLTEEDNVVTMFEIPLSFSADDAVDIFLRMNSGGVPLKRTELLFALAITSWPGGRGEIETFLKDIHDHSNIYGNWTGIDKDFILRTCLFLFENDVSLSADKLRKVDFTPMQTNWDGIKDSISDTLIQLSEYGHSSMSIKSHNAIIPIIYYRFKFNKKALHKSKDHLNALFIVSQVKGLFSSATNTTLNNLKAAMEKWPKQPFDFHEFARIYGQIVNDQDSLSISKEQVITWVKGSKDEAPMEKGPDTRLLLSSLPKNREKGFYLYEQDHLHPRKTFDSKDRRNELIRSGIPADTVSEWESAANTLGNLHLLRGRQNRNKSGTPLDEWKKSNKNREFAYDPAEEIKKDASFDTNDSPYDIKYYPLFVEKRADLIINELCDLFQLKP